MFAWRYRFLTITALLTFTKQAARRLRNPSKRQNISNIRYFGPQERPKLRNIQSCATPILQRSKKFHQNVLPPTQKLTATQ